MENKMINTYIYGVLGFILAFIINIPTAALLGPIILIVILSKVGIPINEFNSNLMLLVQVVLGVFIGQSINRENLRQIRKILAPSIIIIVWTFVVTFGLGIIMLRIYDIDKITSFLSTCPAGITEMTVMAVSVGADISIVALFQLSRMIITILIIPFIVNRYTSKTKYKYIFKIKNKLQYIREILKNININGFKKIKFREFRYLFTLFLGFVGAIVVNHFNIPAGVLIGSFLITAIFSIIGFDLPIVPKNYKTIILVLVGTSIGDNIVNNGNENINEFLPMLIIFIIIIFLTSYLTSRIIKRITGWDELSCILAAAPAGITPITIIAYENDCKALEVSILHLARLMSVKMIIWPIILFVL
jgi:hypothetical protein